MARIRSIKPEAFHSESLAQCSVAAERTFWGMSTIADDKGRLRDQPAVINGALWCLRPDHTADHCDDEISQLVTAGVLCRYDADDKQLIHFPSWQDHQKINRPGKSRFAPCPKHDPGPDSVSTHGDDSEPPGSTHGDVTPHSRTDLGTRNRDQGSPLPPTPTAPANRPNGRRRQTVAQQNEEVINQKPNLTRWGEIR